MRTKFNTKQNSSNFLLEIMTLVSSANDIGSNIEFILGEGHLYILWAIEALELILEELHVSTYQSQRKNVELY
jgi:hypothetical protein